MKPIAEQRDLALVQRWLRLEMHVRCALRAAQPAGVRLYLQAGLLLARHRVRPPLEVHRRMLQTLLATSHDAALPWFWRSVCLEHVNLPLAHLKALLGRHDPNAVQAIEAAVQQARDALPCLPPSSHRV